MKIAITGVKNIADLQFVFAAYFRDTAQRFRQARARDDAVLHVVHGRQPPESAERVLSALPQEIPLAVIASDAHFPRVVLPADLSDRGGLPFDGFGEAFHLDQQHRGAILGEACMYVIFYGT